MSNASAAVSLSMLDDDAWDDLPSCIEERRVIPIVGPAGRIDTLPATMRSLHDVRQWRERIRAAERGT